MKKFFNLFLLGIFLLLCFTGCEIDGQPPIANSDSIDENIYASKAPEQVKYTGDQNSYNKYIDGNCTVENFEIEKGILDFPCLNPSNSIIWPGSILDGQSIVDGSFKPITAKRAPVVISCSIQNTGQSVSETITNPTLGNFRDAFNRIIWANKEGAVPALVESDTISVYSYEHLLTELGISTKASSNGLFASASASLKGMYEWESTEQRTKIMMKFAQVYYSCDMDTPNQPSDFFSNDISWNDISNQITPGITPCYVSSVNYGRIALVAIQSSDNENLVRSAFKTSFNANQQDISGQASGSLTDEEKRIISESKVSVYIIGGDVTSAVNVAADPTKWTDYLTNLKNTTVNTPVVPLSYQVNYMKDNTWMTLVLGNKGQARFCNETLTPIVETPDPIVETPDPIAETPDPIAETPDPIAETPTPTPRSHVEYITETWDKPGNYTWNPPANIDINYSVFVTVIAGGGGGGGGYYENINDQMTFFAGEGGKAGEYANLRMITIKPNLTYNITIGYGGEAGSNGGVLGTSQTDVNMITTPSSGGSGGETYISELSTGRILMQVDGGNGGYTGFRTTNYDATGKKIEKEYVDSNGFGDGGDGGNFGNTSSTPKPGNCGKLTIKYYATVFD